MIFYFYSLSEPIYIQGVARAFDICSQKTTNFFLGLHFLAAPPHHLLQTDCLLYFQNIYTFKGVSSS